MQNTRKTQTKIATAFTLIYFKGKSLAMTSFLRGRSPDEESGLRPRLPSWLNSVFFDGETALAKSGLPWLNGFPLIFRCDCINFKMQIQKDTNEDCRGFYSDLFWRKKPRNDLFFTRSQPRRKVGAATAVMLELPWVLPHFHQHSAC